ncbi:threonine synthase, partial [Candidatus Saccharibacteria bacterium]|nr:threonine synthase [Candidatus Saccharibacteria bacterium]
YSNTKGVILETAHPAKFLDEVESILNEKIEVPERLAILAEREKRAIHLSNDFNGFKKWLMDNLA